MRNYYEDLGVTRRASEAEIRSAFFTLSKKYHPDSDTADKDLHAKFVRINEAYQVLKNKDSRAHHDMYLQRGVNQPYRPPNTAQKNAPNVREFREYYTQSEGPFYHHPNFREHDRFYGAHSSPRAPPPPKVTKGYILGGIILWVTFGIGLHVATYVYNRPTVEEQILRRERLQTHFKTLSQQALEAELHRRHARFERKLREISENPTPKR